MRNAILAFALAWLAAAPAFAETQPARVAFAERRALLEADSLCGLFTRQLRAALEAGAWQARGALIRSGWTSARIAELEAAAVRAARARDCADERTLEAAARARAGFAGWARLASLEFRGGERSWIARRTPDEDGWLLKQTIDAPRASAFGALGAENRMAPALALSLSPRETPPASAELVFRDARRARTSLFEIPGRARVGLEAGAPSLATALRFHARERRIRTGHDGVRQVLFVFGDDALGAMALLDPREAAEIRLANGVRVLVEIGDLAAARAFLAAR